MGLFKDILTVFTVEKVEDEHAPCGEHNDHNHWRRKGWPCPACMGQAQRQHELEEDERRARLNAKYIAEELKKQGIKIVDLELSKNLSVDGIKGIPKRVITDD